MIIFNFRSIFVSIVVSSLALAFLSGCGSTSGLQRSDSPTVVIPNKQFATLLVNPVKTENATTDATPERVALAGEELRGMIISQARKTGAFNEVKEEGIADAQTLLLDAEVTRYEDGNAVARLMIGFGAGSSRFDANFEARDGASQQPLGSIFADKNSWVLGGGLAAGQDADSYMPGIAKKVAEELAPLGVNYGE